MCWSGERWLWGFSNNRIGITMATFSAINSIAKDRNRSARAMPKGVRICLLVPEVFLTYSIVVGFGFVKSSHVLTESDFG